MRLSFIERWYFKRAKDMSDFLGKVESDTYWSDVGDALAKMERYLKGFDADAIAQLSVLHAADLWRTADAIESFAISVMTDRDAPAHVKDQAQRTLMEAIRVKSEIQQRPDWGDIKLILGKFDDLSEPSPIIERLDKEMAA